MAFYILKGKHVILTAPNGPPNPAIEPGSILAKCDDGRLKHVGSMHEFMNSEATKLYLEDKERDIEEKSAGEGKASFDLESDLSGKFWASILRSRGWKKASSGYFLECTELKVKRLKDRAEILEAFIEDIDINNMFIPNSRTIVVVTSVYKSPHIDVKVKAAGTVGGGTGVTIPTEATGLPPISAEVNVGTSSSTAGECTWTAKEGESFPVAIQGMLLRFTSKGQLIEKAIIGHDGAHESQPTSGLAGNTQSAGAADAEEGLEDGGLYDFLYGQGWPEWST